MMMTWNMGQEEHGVDTAVAKVHAVDELRCVLLLSTTAQRLGLLRVKVELTGFA